MKTNLAIVLLTVLSIFLVSSCRTENILDYHNYDEYQLNQFHITKGNDTVAIVKSFEISYDNKKLIKEISLKLVPPYNWEYALPIIHMIHHQHPEWEIEIECDYETFTKIK